LGRERIGAFWGVIAKQEDTGKTRPPKAGLKIAYGGVGLDSTVEDKAGKWLMFQPIRRENISTRLVIGFSGWGEALAYARSSESSGRLETAKM
jgi:hypothetical protein